MSDGTLRADLVAQSSRALVEGDATASMPVEIDVVPPPVAPSGVTATATSTSQINLTWADESADEAGFTVERSTDGVNFAQVAQLGAGVTSFASTSLAAGTTYTFRVLAFSANGSSAYSNVAQAKTLPPPPPAAPLPTAPNVLRLAPILGRPVAGPARPVATAPAGPGLTTVRGITVASSIAGQLASLLSASDSAGLALSGGGFRSSQQQIQTRMSNCGTSSYAIYEMPASSCSPPTAKPGASMHEKGLAIDFTNRGSLISSRSNPAFGWLSSNASRFGLYNLPSEPWHWSTNGN